MDKVGAAGQSCGGVEAYSASVLDSRVKVVGIYNTGVIDPGRRWYLKEMKQPIGYFHGGKGDFSYNYVGVSAQWVGLFANRFCRLSRILLKYRQRCRRLSCSFRLGIW